jgi:hypothetical protein
MSNKTQRNLFEDVETSNQDNDIVLDFFENYFNDGLNEDTTDDDIFDAIIELNETSGAVYEYVTGSNEYETIAMNYFTSYFGENLNESTSEEDLEEAIELLFHLCDEVNESFQINEDVAGGIGKGLVYGGLAALAGKGLYHAYKGWKKRIDARQLDAKDAGEMRTRRKQHKERVNRGERYKYVSKRDDLNQSGAYTPPNSAEKQKFGAGTKNTTPGTNIRKQKIKITPVPKK